MPYTNLDLTLSNVHTLTTDQFALSLPSSDVAGRMFVIAERTPDEPIVWVNLWERAVNELLNERRARDANASLETLMGCSLDFLLDHPPTFA